MIDLTTLHGTGTAGELASFNPATGRELGRVRMDTRAEYDVLVDVAAREFLRWRMVPAPQRGEMVRQIGVELRANKAELGRLVTMEMGKILSEGEGEVQEMIDIADFAVGLSRQLYGKTMHSERPLHRMYEQWHPLGPVGVISAFNFPVAVWAWNAMIALVCGNPVIWKPSPETPLCAVAAVSICREVLRRHGFENCLQLVIGSNEEIGEAMLRDERLPLLSFTGSSAVGRHAAELAGRRLGRTILELGGNNAVIVMDDANPDLVLRAVLFGAVGTAGQRCTSTRRLFLQRGIAPMVLERLISTYRGIKAGDPLDPGTLMGPLVNARAVERMMQALSDIRQQGGEVLTGGARHDGNFVEPTIVRSHPAMAMLKTEVFAPILHAIEFETLETAIGWHNDVPQGLSSSIFTTSVVSAETFLSHRGSDCGIANVNIGTSGAEIGGAFGGEKDTGGGRESGSDSWKAYMRRQTNTINWSSELPLAQGVQFL
ncbi:MAG: aldehyde dehydrogenase family protein [Acidobacteriota bacterium]|nr:aldehyde dehydrogenase family protein [Acidobacteriota bacterium]